jgi:tubulin-specific chaperone C
MAKAGRRHIPGYRSDTSSAESSLSTTPAYLRTPPNESTSAAEKPRSGLTPVPAQPAPPNLEPSGESAGLLDPKSAAIRRPTFSTASSVLIGNHTNVHIILPSSASRATSGGALTSLKHCIVDMSVPTANGAPFASLTVKGIRESLLVCGNVDGAAHITGVEGSVIVVSCHQFRMHDCTDCDVYLASSSRPIIEDCHGIRFSKLPETYVSSEGILS